MVSLYSKHKRAITLIPGNAHYNIIVDPEIAAEGSRWLSYETYQFEKYSH